MTYPARTALTWRAGLIGLLAALCAVGPAAAGGAEAALETVADVDLDRYMGRWYQIALLPNRFQAMCAADTTATYSRLPDGRVRVVNACRDDGGTLQRAEGIARLNDSYDDPARLEVRFAPAWLGFLPFVWGDYWILALEPDYSAVLVGAPDRDYLWVLARAPRIPHETYERLLDVARSQGFDVSALRLERPDAVGVPRAAAD